MIVTRMLMLWWGWIEMMRHRHPPESVWLSKYLPMDFEPEFHGLAFAVASVLTAAWVLLRPGLRQWKIRPVLSWTLGLTLVWGLLSTLWLPWLDAAKSYRSMFVILHRALPSDYGCLASKDLGESERAMLQYVTGIVSVRREVHPDAGCDFILVQNRAMDDETRRQEDWQLIWEGSRPGDNNELFGLFGRRYRVAKTETKQNPN